MKLNYPRLEEDFAKEKELYVIALDVLAGATEDTQAQCKDTLLEVWDGWITRFDGLLHSSTLRGDALRNVRAEKAMVEKQFGVKCNVPKRRNRRDPHWWEKLLRIDPNAPKIREG